jgi:hypothetical protein
MTRRSIVPPSSGTTVDAYGITLSVGEQIHVGTLGCKARVENCGRVPRITSERNSQFPPSTICGNSGAAKIDIFSHRRAALRNEQRQ